MKLIIAGGRDFEDWDLLTTAMVAFVGKYGMPDEIISGMCKTGADALGVRWATENNILLTPFEAKWTDFSEPYIRRKGKYGEYNALAGPNRNTEMAKYGDMGLVFWDKKSDGAGDMIKKLKAAQKPCIEINY